MIFFFCLSISSIWTWGYNTLKNTYFYFFDQSVLLLVIRLRKLINLYFMFLDFPHDLSGGKKAVKSFWQTRKWLNKRYNVRVSFVMCLLRGQLSVKLSLTPATMFAKTEDWSYGGLMTFFLTKRNKNLKTHIYTHKGCVDLLPPCSWHYIKKQC